MKRKCCLLGMCVFWMCFVSAVFAADTEAEQEKDYSSYLYEVWKVEKEEESDLFYTPTFFISNIENGNVEGKFGYPEGWNLRHRKDIPDPVIRNFQGTWKENVIEGTVTLEDGNTGSVKIQFLGEKRAVLYMKYIGERKIVDKSYNMKVYNYFEDVVDESYIEEKNRSLPVHLDFFGDVYLQTGVRDTQKTTCPEIYLTDADGDIIYDFSMGYINNTEVRRVISEDFNGDGISDIKFWTSTLDHLEDEGRSYSFIQQEGGGFYLWEIHDPENWR